VGIAQSALILLGLGIVSSRFKAGVGLQELGLGIRELGAAPLGGLGAGLGEFSGGLRDFAEAMGDIGRGFGELFKHIPKWVPGAQNGLPPSNGNGNGDLIVEPGGNEQTYLVGGGGNVPTNGPVLTLGTSLGPVTGTYSQIFQHYTAMGFTPSQVHSLVDPHFTSMNGGYLV